MWYIGRVFWKLKVISMKTVLSKLDEARINLDANTDYMVKKITEICEKIGPRAPGSKEEFAAQTLAIELYLEAGIRACEIGSILADRDPVTRENRYSDLELTRLAIARRVYTDNHMAVIAAALKNIKSRADKINAGYRIVEEAPILRHFTVKLEKIER